MVQFVLWFSEFCTPQDWQGWSLQPEVLVRLTSLMLHLILRKAKSVRAMKSELSQCIGLSGSNRFVRILQYSRPTTYFESAIDQTKWHFSHAQCLSYRLKLGGWEANNRQTRELACRSAWWINVIGIGSRKSEPDSYGRRLFRADPQGDARIEMDCINVVSSSREVSRSVSHNKNSSIL